MYTVEENEVDIFAIGSIYDTIVDLNNKIKYSFNAVVKCNPSENLLEHQFLKNQRRMKQKPYTILKT